MYNSGAQTHINIALVVLVKQRRTKLNLIFENRTLGKEKKKNKKKLLSQTTSVLSINGVFFSTKKNAFYLKKCKFVFVS